VLVAAAFVPGAPVLVPELSGPELSEVVPVRVAALRVCRDLAEICRRWVIVGGGDSRRPVSPRGTFAGFGADLVVDLDSGSKESADPAMPTAFLLGGWLHAQTAPEVTLTVEVTDRDAPASHCHRQGLDLRAKLATVPEPVGLLVVADGATTLTEKAPGGLEPEAVGYQQHIDAALETADYAAIARLDEFSCARFGVDGRAAWQLAAGAFDDSPVTSGLRYAGAPFGVGYTVAWWTL
jgi:hypothetical protein